MIMSVIIPEERLHNSLITQLTQMSPIQIYKLWDKLVKSKLR